MRRPFSTLLILALAGALAWLIAARGRGVPGSPHLVHAASSRESAPPAGSSPHEIPGAPSPPAPAPSEASAESHPINPGPVPIAATAEITSGPEAGAGLAPGIVMDNMRAVFRQYGSRFGGNPVGTNLEITRALNGQNPGHAIFINSEAGMRVNERGELVDNWGTPYFFHQLSGTVMEIHSAGPDRKMWTPDDLVIR